MYSLIFLFTGSFLVCLLLTPVCRDAFAKAGLFDQPDQRRKVHTKPIPRVGGIPIAVSFVAGFVLLMLSELKGGSVVVQHLPLIWRLLPAACLVFATGLLDDIRGLKPWQKLLGQVSAAALAYWAGVRVLGIAGVATGEWWWSFPLTVAWLTGCTNAFNLIDGVDGLASGIGLFATMTTLAVALAQGNMTLALATAPLAGALAAFLRFNFNPASIFLGDSGSLLIGFLLGCYGVMWSQKSATILAMTAPVMVLSIPILDACLSIGRRFLCRQPIFAADRGHIHHRLLDRGLTPRRVALLLYGFCALGAALSLVQSLVDRRLAPLVLALFCIAAWVAVGSLGYVEFRVARRVLMDGTLRRLLSDQIRLRHLENAIGSAVTPNDCWQVVREAAAGFGFTFVRLRLLDETYERRLTTGEGGDGWTLRIPISESDFLNCTRAGAGAAQPAGLASFADSVGHALRARLPNLRPTGTLDPSLVCLAQSVAAMALAAGEEPGLPASR